ncbi:hypothetical protein C2845_PM01G47870 [Panicum miliaceum]|uniref:Uncharacterized protein n=1 Tax=Panicum miliaceum TaxID=4540 RepID=A0A3L6TNK9_PANMI|nr:hypothetical protein C2845_PM01G47870 [Panicum miliaceum]
MGDDEGGSGSDNPSQQYATSATSQANTNPLAMEPASSKQRKGKRPLPSSSHTNSSYLRSGHKKQMVSYTKSRAIAEASAKAAPGGSARITIETSAGRAVGTTAKATINVSGGTGSAKIRSTSTGRG